MHLCKYFGQIFPSAATGRQSQRARYMCRPDGEELAKTALKLAYGSSHPLRFLLPTLKRGVGEEVASVGIDGQMRKRCPESAYAVHVSFSLAGLTFGVEEVHA